MGRGWVWLLTMALLGASLVVRGAFAQPAEPAAPTEDALTLVQTKAAQIRALAEGSLEPKVRPASLFDVSLDDERAIGVEVERLRAVLAVFDAPPPAEGGAGGTGGAESGGAGGAKSGGGGAAPGGGAPGDDAPGDHAPSDPYRAARLELDRATLAFLALPPAERKARLDQHRARQEEVSEAERRRNLALREKEEADAARERALAEAEQARSATRRLIAEEAARLNGIKAQYATQRHELKTTLEALQRDGASELIEWDERIDTWLASKGSPADMEAHFDELVKALQVTRDEAEAAIGAFRDRTSTVPVIGADPLATLPPGDDVTPLRVLRGELRARRLELVALEDQVVQLRARFLVSELEVIRRGRTRLLPRLSSARRDPLFGYGTVGRSEARGELDRVDLVLTYHGTASRRWLTNLAVTYRDQPLSAYWSAIKVLIALALFAWWHRRSRRWLEAWQKRVRDRAPAGRLDRWLSYQIGIQGPLEWLLLFWIVLRLLPDAAADLIELQILGTILFWILGEALVVNTINTWASSRSAPFRTEPTRFDESLETLRLRSLHFVGRLVVLFGLGLSLSAQLAGEGTLYHWVWDISLLVALPALLVPVHWSRSYIFHRIAQRRKQGGLSAWVEENRAGWLSFPAACLGALFLLGRAGLRFLRSWVSGFDLARRALAYWFRRELSRNEEGPGSTRGLAPLSDAEREALDPERPAEAILDSTADPMVEQIIERVNAKGGGVYAVVGERGSGKSTLLRRIEDRCDSESIACPFDTDTLLATLCERLELPKGASLSALGRALDSRSTDVAVLVDDAHHLVRPCIGGLDDFDRLIQLARESSQKSCTWVFVLDVVIWQFIERARGAQPLFDEVIQLEGWTEEQITGLLEHRCESASLEPRFDEVVTDLPRDADAIDRQDALERAETNYYRLLWDYADGNPGVALHFWRESLGADDQDASWVHLFSPPSTADFERLPDDALFVLRAIVQLDRAALDDIATATMLPGSVVQNALRYALGRGYVERDEDGRYRVSWQWFRAITNFLVRRHLLVATGAGT